MTSPTAPSGSAPAVTPSDASRPRRRRRAVVVTAVLILVVVAAGIFASVLAYQKKERAHGATTNFSAQTSGVQSRNNQPTASYVEINASLVSVSPDAQTADVRLVFGYWLQNSPTDSPFSPEQLTVSALGTLTDTTANSDPSANSYTFAANQSMRTIDIQMNLGDDNSLKYPFDSYTGYLAFRVTDSNGKVVPNAVAFTDGADGWTVSTDGDLCSVVNAKWYPLLSLGPDTPDCSNGAPAEPTALDGLSVGIHREAISQIYALFIMALMWMLALSGVITVLIVVRKKDFEFDFLLPTYLAALLFAFPLIRGLLPGNPQLGVLADFASYFWVEAVVGVTLLVLVITWVNRTRRVEEAGGSPDVDNPEVGEPG